jgi:hypothetical protein
MSFALDAERYICTRIVLPLRQSKLDRTQPQPSWTPTHLRAHLPQEPVRVRPPCVAFALGFPTKSSRPRPFTNRRIPPLLSIYFRPRGRHVPLILRLASRFPAGHPSSRCVITARATTEARPGVCCLYRHRRRQWGRWRSS